jgi:hypothetical protein
MKLEALVDAMQTQSDEMVWFYDKKAEECIFASTDSSYDEILYVGDVEEHHIPLPSKFEIDEYRMMTKFTQIQDDEVYDKLDAVLHGNGAFRKFKDMVFDLGIREEWFVFRDKMYAEIAEDWAKREGIEIESS